MKQRWNRRAQGFTIVELLIVVVVIAILAAIVVVSYNGITSRARQSATDQGASQNRTKIELAHADSGSYPANADSLSLAGTYEYTQTGGGTGYCLTTYGDAAHSTATKVENGVATSGAVCTGHAAIGSPASADGIAIQTITAANCPTARTRAVDARDNHSYWVQKMADGKCWMLTNLAYAGGGIDTYSDVILTSKLTNGTADTTGSYTAAKYYVVPSTTSYTTEPANPSTSTNGTGQYGYLYNFCAANGGQTGNGACGGQTAVTPVNTAITICPAGWRLPTGGTAGELIALNTAINSGSANVLSTWLAQWGGSMQYGYGGFLAQGESGYYVSSTLSSSFAGAYFLVVESNGSAYSAYSDYNKNSGYAVRCVAR